MGGWMGRWVELVGVLVGWLGKWGSNISKPKRLKVPACKGRDDHIAPVSWLLGTIRGKVYSLLNDST